MRVKRTKKPARPSKPARSIRSIRSKKAAVPAASTNLAWVTTSRAIVTGMIFVVVAAALLTAREEPPRVNVEPEHSLPATPGYENDTPRPIATAKATGAKTSAAAKPEPPSASLAHAVGPQREVEAAEEPDAAHEQPPAQNTATVTITGCLEKDDAEFRLTDAAGVDAPTSRSWKSGFLKKRPAHVEIADAVGTLNLRNLTGRRVAATGMLLDRELRARAVRLVGSCD